jgi:hypothetical protein
MRGGSNRNYGKYLVLRSGSTAKFISFVFSPTWAWIFGLEVLTLWGWYSDVLLR